MDEEERGLLVDYIAPQPVGQRIPGTGGVRALVGLGGAWSGAGHEWSIITTATPCSIFGVVQADRNDFRRLTALLVED